MAQNLTKHFVDLRRLRLTPQAFTKLALDDTKGRLHVAPLVIVLHEGILIEHEEVIHLLPHVRCFRVVGLRVRLERNVRRAAFQQDEFQVTRRRVRLVTRYVLKRKVLRCRTDERHKVRTVGGVRVRNFNRRDDVGLNARADVNLNPILPIDFVGLLLAVQRARLAPLGIAPSLIRARRETGRVNSEVRFNRLQRQRGLCD